MSNNLDNLFKKALQEQQCEPPARIWEHIEGHLARRKRRALWWYRSLAAAAMFAVCFGVWQLYQQDSSSTTVETVGGYSTIVNPKSTAIPQQERNANKVTERQSNSDVLLASKESEVKGHSVGAAKTRLQTVPVNIRRNENIVTIANNSLPVEIEKKSIRTNFIPLTSKEALKNHEQYQTLLNTKLEEAKVKNTVKFALSGHFIPAYSSGSYSSSVKNTRGYSYSDDQMEGLMNVGGGLKLSINTGKRFSFQTGIFYSRMGQKTTDNNEPLRTSAFSSASTEERVATPLGNIKSRRKAVGERTTEAIVLNSIASGSEEVFEQVFGTLEVPMYVRYRLNNNKMSFSVIGGFSGNFIVDNKVYLKTDNEKELLGSTKDIRNFNMSTDWSIGMEYPLTQKIKIMLEPGFRYYLQSLSRNNNIDFKPYMFSLSTGIGIEF